MYPFKLYQLDPTVPPFIHPSPARLTFFSHCPHSALPPVHHITLGHHISIRKTVSMCVLLRNHLEWLTANLADPRLPACMIFHCKSDRFFLVVGGVDCCSQRLSDCSTPHARQFSPPVNCSIMIPISFWKASSYFDRSSPICSTNSLIRLNSCWNTSICTAKDARSFCCPGSSTG